jgi:nitrite reductase/ring-hydroxylating ferredoxin subunit/uncharacterized membrane protein
VTRRPAGLRRGRRGYAHTVRQPLTPARRSRARHRRAVARGKSPGSFRLASLAERIERAPALDRVIAPLSGFVVRALPAGPRADALHGVPFGQPAHPAIVRMPLGCWTSAVLLDVAHAAAGQRRGGSAARDGLARSSRVLIAAGLAAAVPAAATGLADWSALHQDQQRVGLAHLAVQGSAVVLFAGSLLLRVAGGASRRYGTLLSAAGLATATAGAYLGGHLALRLGAGASHADQVGHLTGLGWHDLCPAASLPDRRPVRRQLGYLSLLVYRSGDTVHVLADRCAHLGGPLHQGRVVQERGTACVTCPWHGSTFALASGRVIHGPATARQPSFESRLTPEGTLQVRPR